MIRQALELQRDKNELKYQKHSFDVCLKFVVWPISHLLTWRRRDIEWITDDLKIASVEPLEETRISVHIACLTDTLCLEQKWVFLSEQIQDEEMQPD